MIIKATQKNTRQTPRKLRYVANAVKKLPLAKALDELAVMERRATLVIIKTLRQAIANAMHNHGYTFDDLKLDNILITEGPRYRRFQAVSRGRAHGLIKRTSHVTVILKAGEDSLKKTQPVVTPKVVESTPKTATKKAVAVKPVKTADESIAPKTNQPASSAPIAKNVAPSTKTQQAIKLPTRQKKA